MVDSDLGIPESNETREENQTFSGERPALKPGCAAVENVVEGRKQLKGEKWYKRGLKIKKDKSLAFEHKSCRAKQMLEKDFPESIKQLRDTEKQHVTFTKKPGCDQESLIDAVEIKVNNFIHGVDYTKMAKEDQNLQHTARAITNQVITDALIYRCNEVQTCPTKTDLHTKINEKKEDRRAQVEKEKLQKQELVKRQRKLEKLEKAYEETVAENRQLRERIGDLRKEQKDSHLKYLEERATWINSQATYRFKMKEMEKYSEQMQRTTISLEREIEKLEHKSKLDESKIAKLEVQINILDGRAEEKDLLIEQLLHDKYRKRGIKGFLGCL